MKLIQFNKRPPEMPVKVVFSLEKMMDEFKRFAEIEGHPYQKSSAEILRRASQFPQLKEGMTDMAELERCEAEIEMLLRPLFSDPLQNNEIKAVLMPFTFQGFHPTKRFADIIENAGADFEFSLVDYDEKIVYLYACSFILAQYYQKTIDFARPMYINIPDKRTGQMRHYRGLINADFTEVIKTDAAPEITQSDIEELLQNAGNVDLWKKKFPPGSYIFKGFGIVNLFDVTQDVIITNIRSLFLRNDDRVFDDFRESLKNLMGIDDLMVGYSTYDLDLKQSLGTFFNRGTESLFLKENERVNYSEIFCEGIQSCVMQNVELIAISDIEKYGERNDRNNFYHRLIEKDIQSLILIPIKIGTKYLQIIELGSIERYKLNALNANKLRDVIPFMKIAAQRYIEERLNILESTIQENYTSIHPTVKWRFDKASIWFNRQKIEGIESPVLEEISFDDIYPIYGQSDIKGSSTARNDAIQEDLISQLNLIIDTFEKILEVQDFPIYKKLIFRVNNYLKNVKDGLNAGDESSILQFLRVEIYPVFSHLKNLNPTFEAAVLAYMAEIDPDLQVVYRARKAYDDSVGLLNDRMAHYLDKRQVKAQEMYPHYFQRYKTDGVEYNIYIGGSMVQNREFSPIYLQNMRLWQLETMWGLEQVARNLLHEMPYPLQVASLILVHSHSLSIRFHMDQKAFDVDGAYNARYEIIKKRIDKSHIKGTNERLTQTGKLAIVYSQDSDADEYLEYLRYWQSEGLFGKIELLELEDLQGVSGLKAIRVEVLYEKEMKITMEELAVEDAEILN